MLGELVDTSAPNSSSHSVEYQSISLSSPLFAVLNSLVHRLCHMSCGTQGYQGRGGHSFLCGLGPASEVHV